ncbi:MAG: DUF1905 domain-containing protein [Pseudomonadota bacterium]
MDLNQSYEISGEVVLWNFEKGSWHFFVIPREIADEIKFFNANKLRGFRSLKVKATIGETIFATSIFPDSKSGGYFLPLKASVRKSENIVAGDIIMVQLSL